MALVRILSLFVFSIFMAFAAQAEGQRVILVLDASGSMWGKIGDQSKMDIAKNVVGKVISTWKPEDEIGLVAYGHRVKGSCEDIETLLEPGRLDANGFMAAVGAISPKGKTPMTQAVRQAAEALKYAEKQATVILVSDGIETCDPNPCAVAEDLEKLGVDLTVHTVGFGLDDRGAVEQLRCLAEKTGGISVLAENTDELESALKQTVEAEVEEPAPPAAPEFNLTGHVVMAEGVELAPPHDQPGWSFTFSNDGQPGEYIRTEYGRDVRFNMEKTGSMLVKIETDYASVAVPFTMEQGGTARIDANLNAGYVVFKGMMDAATPVTNEGASWAFAKADGTYVGTTYGVAPRHLLNAGDYKVKLQDGQAESEAAFTVLPGQTVDVVVTLGSGAVRVSGTYSPGGEALPDGTAVEFRMAPDISGEKKWIATDYGNNRVFKAAAGNYVVIVALDYAKAEVPFTIASGQEAAVEVNLNAGFLAVSAPGANSIDIMSGEKALDGTRQRIGGEYAAELNKAVNAGTYHVVARDAGNAVIAERDVTVEAGKRVEITLP